MINLESLLQPNSHISLDELNELEQLTIDYPWFSLAHQLVLMGYKQNNDTRFAGKCQQAAIYALSRKRLSRYIKQISNRNNAEAKHIINSNENNFDDLLINFNTEYFSIEDIAPIDAPEENIPDSDLINKFIVDKPRIIPKSPLEPDDLDDRIEMDDSIGNEPISETLAEIYISQGLYNLAIECYEKLSLQNPEKSVYFATLINDLRDKKK